MVAGFLAFFITRHARYRRDKKRDEERAMNTALFGVISSPNGLGDHSATPPPYYEALKSSHTAIHPAGAHAPGHRREKSASMMMDECWKAVYATEESMGGVASPTHPRGNSMMRDVDVEQPASPRGVAHGEMRQSVSRWFRNQKWMPTKPGVGMNPLSSHPTHQGEGTKDLPVPPSPSYRGVPPTPSSLPSTTPTPTTATFLAPGGVSPFYNNNSQPVSARSWMTGDDRLSIRASIPASVLYPSPLQPAPPPKRRSLTRARMESANSQSEHVASTWKKTWKTITPADEPPQYEWDKRSWSRREWDDGNLW